MIITADELPRVIACEGSLTMPAPDGYSPGAQTPEAIEGTACHHVLANVLIGASDNAYQHIGRQTPNGVFITPELAEYVQRVADGITSRLYGVIRPDHHVETQTDFTPFFGFDIHGRADHIAYDPVSETLYIDDAKFGYRIVEPDENWTLIAHAIGFCRWHNIRPKHIVFTIHQPRPFHPLGMSRAWPISIDQLDEYSTFLTEFFDDMGTALNTGPQCRNCRARAHCPSAREAGMNAIDVSRETATIETLDDTALDDTLEQIERATDHLKTLYDALSEVARHRIENNGVTLTKHGLEIAKGNRKWNGGATPSVVAMLALSMGKVIDPATLTEPAKLISPAQAEKLGAPQTVVNALTTRPTLGIRLIKRDLNKVASQLLK
jgi:hypothetical protein